MSKVRSAVIPVAGYGTRFLPFTKAVPKALLPVVNKPAVQLIVEEAVKSGIEQIILVVGQNREIIENHFSANPELEAVLEKRGSYEFLQRIKEVSGGVKIICVVQPEQTGTASAVLCAREFIDDGEPFAIMFGDDVMSNDYPVLKQLIDVYDRTQKTVIGVKNVGFDEVTKYASVEYSAHSDAIYQVTKITEKPTKEEAKSDLAPLGRYVVRAGFMERLKNLKPGWHGEYQLTDALDEESKAGNAVAFAFEGERYDMGDRLGFLKANVEEALKNPEIKGDFEKYLKNLVKKF